MEPIIERLLVSDEPSIWFKICTGVLGEQDHSPGIEALREEIRTSARVTELLAGRSADGTIAGGIYRKWTGAHWVLSTLADIGYPAGGVLKKYRYCSGACRICCYANEA